MIIPGIFGVIFHLKWYTLYFINFDLAFTILTTAVFILFSPKILYGFYPLPITPASEGQTFVPQALADVVKESPALEQKEHKMYMDSAETDVLLVKISAVMREKQPFLNSEYSIHDLSQDTQIPVYQLSPLINQHFSSNFRSWLNRFRVEHFLEISESNRSAELTLDALAQESGFSNRVTFINAFKKEKGTTPGEYLKKRVAQA
jgi:AraC-like DNA-binding protein